MKKKKLRDFTFLNRRFILFLKSCEFEDDSSKLRSFIFYIYHHIRSNPDKNFHKEFDFEKLFESSIIFFSEEVNIAYLEMAFLEIINNRFKIEVWEKEIFNPKKLIDQRKSNPQIKNALISFNNNITINGVINLLNSIEIADKIDLNYLMKEVRTITKDNGDIFGKFLSLLDQKKNNPNVKIKHKKQKKSKLPYFPIAKEKNDHSFPKKPKIYSKIIEPKNPNHENEEDILHRK